MLLKGFAGPSYTSQSIQADCQRSVNLYPEIVESGVGKNRIVLYKKPGLSVFVTLPIGPVRTLFSQDGRTFCLSGGKFYELTNVAPYYIDRGDVSIAGTMGSICSNGTGGYQLFVVSGGKGYIFDLRTNLLTQITAAAFPANAVMGAFLDSYFIVLVGDSNQFQLSAQEDGMTWSGLDVAQRESGSDMLQAIVTNHRQLWLIGSLTTEVWYDSGNASFPLAPIPGAFLERGGYRWSITSFDNTVAFVGQDRMGNGVAYRANDFVPQRFSTFAVEYAWSQYSTIEDVECYSYEEQGHTFLVVDFPTAQHTWVYDASTNLWHERDWWNVDTGLYEAQRQRTHCFSWGMHLVGDRANGNVYIQSLSTYQDNAIEIRCRRRCPHICEEKSWVFYNQVILDCAVGLGIPTGGEPYAILRFSDDGALTWSNDMQASIGLVGKTFTLPQWNCLGRSRDRVFEWEITLNQQVQMINAYWEGEKGSF